MTADGDAGSAYLQGVNNPQVGDPNNPYGSVAQANAFAEGAKNLLGQAKSGGWAISEEGGNAFWKALMSAETTMTDSASWTELLTKAPPLGNDAYAKQVANHVLAAMNSDDNSLVQVMNKFKEGLVFARQAIEIAKKNYNVADESAIKHLGTFEG